MPKYYETTVTLYIGKPEPELDKFFPLMFAAMRMHRLQPAMITYEREMDEVVEVTVRGQLPDLLNWLNDYVLTNEISESEREAEPTTTARADGEIDYMARAHMTVPRVFRINPDGTVYNSPETHDIDTTVKATLLPYKASLVYDPADRPGVTYDAWGYNDKDEQVAEYRGMVP